MNKKLLSTINSALVSTMVVIPVISASKPIKSKKYEMVIDGELKTFASKQEAIDFLIKKGNIQIEQHIGTKHFKNDDGIVNYDETLLAKLNFEKLSPAYKFRNGGYTRTQQDVINDYLSRSKTYPKFLDLMGNEYDEEADAKRSIRKQIEGDLIDNAFYSAEIDGQKKYFNLFVKEDMEQLINHIESTNNGNKLLDEKQGILLKDGKGNEKLIVESKLDFFKTILKDFIEDYKNSLNKQIYRIELELPLSWVNKTGWYKEHYAKFENYEVEKGQDNWKISNNGKKIYKNVDIYWLKKYLNGSEENYDLAFKNKDPNSLIKLFSENVEKQFKRVRNTHWNARREFSEYYVYGKQFLDFDATNGSKFLDFKKLKLVSWANEFIRGNGDGTFCRTSSIFQTWENTWNNYGLNISIKKKNKANEVLANDIKNNENKNIELLKNTFKKHIKNNLFIKEIEPFFNSLYKRFKDYILSKLLSNENMDDKLMSIDYGRFNMKINGKEDEWNEFKKTIDTFDYAFNANNVEEFINTLFTTKIYTLDSLPYYTLNNEIKKYLNGYDTNLYTNEGVLHLISINTKKYNDITSELIKILENKNDFKIKEDYKTYTKTIDKIKLMLKHQKNYALTNKISFFDKNDNYEDKLLTFLQNSSYLFLNKNNKINFEIFRSLVYHNGKEFRLNNSYSKETTFTSDEELKEFRKTIVEDGFTPRVRYVVDGLDDILKENNIVLPKNFFNFNSREMILQNCHVLLEKLIQPAKDKIFYKNSKNNWNLLDLKYFNLWKFNFNNETLYFENEENVYKYVEKYVEANIKEKQ